MNEDSDDSHPSSLNVEKFTEEDFEQCENLREFLDNISVGNAQQISVRHLTMLSGNYRRGSRVKSHVLGALSERGLVSRPPFEQADYWGDVLVLDPRDLERRPSTPVALPISSLQQGSTDLTSVKAEDLIDVAETQMILNDFSQLPVLTPSGRELKGSISWKSIAAARIHGTPKRVRDAMVAGGHVAGSSDSLMDLVPHILSNDYIFYRNEENKIVGIVTATDLAETFQDTTGVFIRISEIENRIRDLLDRIPLPQLREFLDPNIDRSGSDFSGASSMTFGEYVRALEAPETWNSLGIMYNRTLCIENLRDVNKVRNSVMHFRLGAIESQSSPEEVITQCLNWLRGAS